MTIFSRTYYGNGNISSEYPRVGKKTHGLAKWYWEDGTLMWEIPYRNNMRHGIRKEYSRDGSLEKEIVYIDDVMRSDIDISNRLVRTTLFGEAANEIHNQ